MPNQVSVGRAQNPVDPMPSQKADVAFCTYHKLGIITKHAVVAGDIAHRPDRRRSDPLL